MPECIETVLKQAVQIINFIKARPLNARLFPLLCQELGAKHEQLLFQTEVRWLSRGRVLHRIYELRSEVMTFLVNVQSDLVQYLDDLLWLADLPVGGAVRWIKERHQTVTHLQLFLSAVILFERDAWISSVIWRRSKITSSIRLNVSVRGRVFKIDGFENKVPKSAPGGKWPEACAVQHWTANCASL